MIIGITGTNGAGKGVVVQYLVKQKGFTHYSVSGYLSSVLVERDDVVDRTNRRRAGNK